MKAYRRLRAKGKEGFHALKVRQLLICCTIDCNASPQSSICPKQ